MHLSKVNKIILGTVQFGTNYGINNTKGRPSKEDVFQILDKAFSLGIGILDTAEAYGDSHKIISEYHLNSVNRFEIITKYSNYENEAKPQLVERVDKLLKQFKTPRLYGYMFHSFDDFRINYDFFAEQITKLKSTGKVNKIGVSVYSNMQLEELLTYDCIDLVQLPFNLLDNHSQRFSILDKTKKRGLEIHTRSSFLQGLFFKDIDTLSGTILELKDELKKIRDFCKSNLISIHQLAINYPLSKNYIDKVLIGIDSITQLESNIQAINRNYDSSLFTKIDRFEVKNSELLNPSKWKQ